MKGRHGGRPALRGESLIESKRLSARVESYRDAIAEARSAGITWEQIAAVLGCKPKYLAALYHKPSRYKSPVQLPLPDPAKKATSTKANEVKEQVQMRPLPTVPGTIPADQDERLAELAKKGIVFR